MEEGDVKQKQLDMLDIVFILLLGSLSFFKMYWLIWHPTGVVFDEVYFGNFSNYYIKSQYYHDIHPPLAKMVMFFVANLSEYDGTIDFVHNPTGYENPDYIQLRITPASFSAMCVPLVYLSVRFLGFSHIAAFTSGFLLLCDLSIGVEGRHILSDGILHFFAVLHICVLFYTMSIPKLNGWFHFWHIMTGITLGAASSCKNTAWGLAVLDAAAYIVYLYAIHKNNIIDYVFDVLLYGTTLFLINFLVYLLTFYVHFILLPISGPGHVFLEDPMKAQLLPNQAINSSLHARRLKGPSLFTRTVVHTIKTHKGNMGIRQFHDSQSFPHHWPILGSVVVYFWAQEGREIRCIGNVFTYYYGLFCLIIQLFAYKKSNYIQAVLLAIGYSSCYFPFYLIPRVLYLYHYLIPLMIACMSVGSAMDLYLPPKIKGICCIIMCATALFGFWLWMDYMYGTPMKDKEITIWNQNWIDGDLDHRKRRDEHYKSKNK